MKRTYVLAVCLLSGWAAELPATTIVATTQLGPVRSTDGGSTWKLLPMNVNSGLISRQPGLYAVVVDPKTPSTWYATGAAGDVEGLFRTTDAGETWSASVFVGFKLAGAHGALAIDPVATNTLYMIASTNNSATEFLAKSTDAGATWTALQLPNTATQSAGPVSERCIPFVRGHGSADQRHHLRDLEQLPLQERGFRSDMDGSEYGRGIARGQEPGRRNRGRISAAGTDRRGSEE
jgi:hypothetical protein